MKKAVSIIIKAIFTLITLFFGIMTLYAQSLYKQAVDSDSPIINYGGTLYEQEKLIEEFAAERTMMLVPFIISLVITVALYFVLSNKKAKN